MFFQSDTGTLTKHWERRAAQCKTLDLLGFAGLVVVAVNRLALRRGGFVGGRALPAIVLPMQYDSCQNAEDVSMKVHRPRQTSIFYFYLVKQWQAKLHMRYVTCRKPL